MQLTATKKDRANNPIFTKKLYLSYCQKFNGKTNTFYNIRKKVKMKKDGFFSSTHIYPIIWTIIVSLLAFFGGLLWENYSGPDEVVVINRDNSKDTTVTVIEFKPDQDYFDHLTDLTSKSVVSEYSSKVPNKNIEDISFDIANEYQSKFDSIISSRQKTQVQKSESNISEVSSGGAKIKRPKFKMPSIVEGYVKNNLNSIATLNINSTEFQKNDKLKLNLNIFNSSTLNEITPVFVDVVEQKGDKSYYQIWNEQYEVNQTDITIAFSTDFKKGKYELTVGFYRLDEINSKYPAFYSKTFNIIIN